MKTVEDNSHPNEISDTNDSSDDQFLPKGPKTRKFFIWKCIQLISYFISYTSLYLAFSMMSVCAPLLTGQSGSKSGIISRSQIGYIVSIANASRLFPKVASGTLADIFGGTLVHVSGNLISATGLILIGFFGYNFVSILLLWILASCGTGVVWNGIIKTVGNWVAHTQTGTIMAILSQSYLVGDGLARGYLALWIYLFDDAHITFLIGGVSIISVTLVCVFMLRESPKSIGEPEVPPNPDNLLAHETEEKFNVKMYIPLIKSPSFWIVSLKNVGYLFIRIVFVDWSTTFLVDFCSASNAVATLITILFPVSGGLATLFVGFLNDRLSNFRRNLMLLSFIIIQTLIITLLWILIFINKVTLVPTLIILVLIGFFLFGPYSLYGTIAIGMGGRHITATIAACFDGFGMIGALSSGLLGGLFFEGKNTFEEKWKGWIGLFSVVLGMSVALIILTILFCIAEYRKQKNGVNQKIQFLQNTLMEQSPLLETKMGSEG